jgi:hypothetical protein
MHEALMREALMREALLLRLELLLRVEAAVFRVGAVVMEFLKPQLPSLRFCCVES